MDTTEILICEPAASEPKLVPSYRKPALRPTTNCGLRIYEDQKRRLDADYIGTSSELVRILLDKYFRGEILGVREQITSI